MDALTLGFLAYSVFAITLVMGLQLKECFDRKEAFSSTE
jgi:hypothetical protein